MANIFDYLTWRGDLTFKQAPFNIVDNIILTHLSYLPFDYCRIPGEDAKEKIPLSEAAVRLKRDMAKNSSKYKNMIMFKEDPDFLNAAASTKRFGEAGLTCFVNRIDTAEEKQFAALTIITDDGIPFVSFRGTDTTIIAWKEDFKLSFADEIPAQREALKYLETIGRRTRGKIRIGGHSKGGNLAVYAASFCNARLRRRIIEIYTDDSPGFSPAFVRNPGYLAVRDKIISLVPESSIIGMLFKHAENYTVVKSIKNGILQHDVYSWQISGADVVRVKDVDSGSVFVNKTMQEWLAGLSLKQREEFTDALFNILSSTEAKSFPELGKDWLKHAVHIAQTFVGEEASREMLLKTLGSLLKAAKNNIYTLLPAKSRAKSP